MIPQQWQGRIALDWHLINEKIVNSKEKELNPENHALQENLVTRIGGYLTSPPSTILRMITGWALLAAAAGTIFDAYACDGCSTGSIGLIPLYLGFPIGSVGLVIIFKKVAGWIPALLIALGLSGILYFMFAYPNGVEGWIGAIFIGIAHLFLPLSGRFASLFWVSVGILGFPDFPAFGVRSWGLINVFMLFGAATAVSGIFIVWGLKSINTSQVIEKNP